MVGMFAEEEQRWPGQRLLARVANRVPEFHISLLEMFDVFLDGSRLVAVLMRQLFVVAGRFLLFLEHLHKVVPNR